MLPRLFTTLIIGFWLVMTGLLMESLWFPADSRLTKVNPGAVLQLISARGEDSDLDIYDDKKIIGQITVKASNAKLSLRRRTQLRIAGRLNVSKAQMAGTNIRLTSRVDLDHSGDVLAFFLELTAGGAGPTFTISQSAPESPPHFLLKHRDAVLLDSATLTTENAASNPMIAMLMAAMGGSLPDLSSIRRQAESGAAAMTVEARQGKFDLNGSSRQGYIVRLGKPGQPGFRLCVENTGEIVSLETPTSFRLLTQTLRPEDAPHR